MKKSFIVWIAGMALCGSSASAALIAHWTFDDTLTNSVSSKYGAVSIGASTPQYSTDAKYGKSLLFVNPENSTTTAANKLSVLGGGDWIGANSWTFSAWIKPTTLATNTHSIFTARSASTIYALYSDLRGSKINTYYNDDGTNGLTGIGVATWGGTTNEWYRYTVTFNADTKIAAAYRDSSDAAGGLVLLRATTNYCTPLTAANFILGASTGAGGWGFQGYMDDVRIYNTALSQSEVDVISAPDKP